MTDLHAIEPVSIDRLAELCEIIDADYAIIEAPRADAEVDAYADDVDLHRVLQTGIPHIAVHCDLSEDGDVLSIFATWEGKLAAVEEEAVAATVAELNWASVAPTVSYLVSGDEDDKAGAPGEIQLCANRAMAVGEGLSLGQLGHFLLSSLASFAEIFDVIAERFPQAMTWNDSQEQETEEKL